MRESKKGEGTEKVILNNGVKPKNTGPVMDAPFKQLELLKGKEGRCFVLAVPGPVTARVCLRHGDK